ncbi:MAG: hypothetical protein ACFCUN_04355 [Hyphomicrobiaceae bacterium]
MSSLIRLILVNSAIGFAAAAVFVALLLAFDIAGLGTLVAGSDVALLAVVMLVGSTGLTFASVQVGVAIMAKSEPDSNG